MTVGRVAGDVLTNDEAELVVYAGVLENAPQQGLGVLLECWV